MDKHILLFLFKENGVKLPVASMKSIHLTAFNYDTLAKYKRYKLGLI